MSGEPAPVTLDFPENVVEELAISLDVLEGIDVVVKRPLKPTDPNGAAGVYAVSWNPEGYQIGQYDPAVTQYLFAIQTFVKHGDDEGGVALHSRLAKRVRVMLYRDDELRVRLGTLYTDESGIIERTQKWGVRTQRYLSNELQGTFMYLAVTEMYLETEIV